MKKDPDVNSAPSSIDEDGECEAPSHEDINTFGLEDDNETFK